MYRFSGLFLAFALLATPALADTPLPVQTGGRVFPQADPAQGYLHQWPGTYFEARFKGPAVTVRLNDAINIVNIYIDGKKVRSETTPGQTDLKLGPLTDAEHTIRLEKLTEVQGEAAGFVGFFVPEATNVLPAPASKARRIEFIGDSHTVGYGNTSPVRQCPGDGVWATTDTQQAFGPMIAKHFEADYRINAISGRGIVRNYNGGAGNPLPKAYSYDVDAGGVTYTRTGDAWSPQIIVIGLGTNDFSTPLNPGEPWATRDALHADYEATYIRFVQGLRAKHPKAFFILTATDQMDGEYEAEVKKVITGLQAAGESRIAFLRLPPLEMTACDWHPSLADDLAIRDLMVGWIKARPELWQE